MDRRDFTRDDILSPERLVTLLLHMVGDANRRGYRHVLDAFWDECASHGIPLPCEEPVTGSAFCQARDKISNEMLRELLHDAAAIFEETYPERSQWRGRRVFAIDGSKFNLGRSDELDSHFGRPESAYCPQATVSAHFSLEDISDLYRKRWEAEELYKLEKASCFDQHQFHARQPHGVKQEILAQALFVVIARFLMATAADAVGADSRDLSPKSAVLGRADYMTRICLTSPRGASRWLPRLLARIARTRDKKRPNRSFPRRSFRPGPR